MLQKCPFVNAECTEDECRFYYHDYCAFDALFETASKTFQEIVKLKVEIKKLKTK